jgi:hypothetical protein
MSHNYFNPDGYAVAAKDFTYAGTTYALNEPFPHLVLGVIPHELRGLWMAGLIRFERPPVAVEVPVATTEQPAKQRAKPALRTQE